IPGSALDTVGSFDSNAALSDAAQSGDNLLSGLEAADLRRVVNWRFGSPPVAVADSYGVDEDGTLVVDAGHGVLSNDSDPDGDAITTLLLTHPANGTLTLSADGSFSYTPDADYFGTDGFTYHARDASGSLSSETTVRITVNAV